MRLSLLSAVSALALLAGPALAQTTGTGSAQTPPEATQEAPPPGGPVTTADSPTAPDAADTAQEPVTQPGATVEVEQPATGDAMTQPSTIASAEELMDKDVRGADGENIGSVEDIILDPQTGQAQQLVISSGGFLGIGAKQVAVDIQEAEWLPEEDVIALRGVTQADVENMPEFEMEEGMVSHNQPGATGQTGGNQ